MNKAELIDAIASGADISKVKAGEVIDAFVSTVTSALKNGDTVTLVGFGSFTTAEPQLVLNLNQVNNLKMPLPKNNCYFNTKVPI